MSKFKIGDTVCLTELGRQRFPFIGNEKYTVRIIDIIQTSSDMIIQFECILQIKSIKMDTIVYVEENEITFPGEEHSCRDTVGLPWIGVDLDGTLAKYTGWEGFDKIGEPISEVVERVKEKLASGVQIKIMTARVCSLQRQEDTDTSLRAITKWCFKHIGQQLPITSEKDYNMLELWDDRVKQVIPNTGIFIEDYLKGSI